ncbi:MAG: c-type cytochrome [Kiloniellaceae bacterium]
MKRKILIFAFAAMSMAAMSMAAAGSAVAGGDVGKGKTLSKKCAACHGKDGKGVRSNPSVVGISTDEFIKFLHEYKSGAKKHKMMNRMAKKLSDDDIENLAAYYSSLK